MDKIVITQFSDPMMGLSWECEPAIHQIEEELGDAGEVRDMASCSALAISQIWEIMITICEIGNL